MFEIIPNWHPIVVHFTVALLLTASVLFVAGTVLRARPSGRTATIAARWNLGIGLLVTTATLITGWWAYNTVAHDEVSHANMTVHLRWALGTALAFVAAAVAAWYDRKRRAGAGVMLIALLAAGSAALAVTGWLGGENVYRYGLGVMALPKSDSHAHPGSAGGHPPDHDHGAHVGDATLNPIPGGTGPGNASASDGHAHDHTH
ncbi:DUF2231 domain-containing protein [Methylobacterium sp.]|uniref:DUF2231 domain-containing protein n=1 Tax=Methylobacterium sp. TaxID=409 RepID=UPI003B019526